MQAKTHNAYAAKLQQLTQQPKRAPSPLVQQNRLLKSEVHTLENEVLSMSKAMKTTLADKDVKSTATKAQAPVRMPSLRSLAQQPLHPFY